MFEPSASGAVQLDVFSEDLGCLASNKPNGAIATRSYSIVYDDDLDSWSVVTTPFDGLHFLGTKSQCAAFVTVMGSNGVRLVQRI